MDRTLVMLRDVLLLLTKKTRKVRVATLLTILSFVCHSCTLNAQVNNSRLAEIRDNLDAITISAPMYRNYKNDVVIHIDNQKQWNNVALEIESNLRKGFRTICVQIDLKTLELTSEVKGLEKLDYPDANIKILGNDIQCIPAGEVFNLKGSKLKKANNHHIIAHSRFDCNDIFLDKNNRAISLYGISFDVDTAIEPVDSEGWEDVENPDGSLYKRVSKIWRFKTHLPNIGEEQCRDFYILLTRDWTSCRHKVVKVEDGYLYFHLISNDAPTLMQMTLDPNVNQKRYKVNPRCRLFNFPRSRGLFFKEESFYIPNNIKYVRIGRGGRLFSVNNCHFNSFEISGFHILGAGNQSCIDIQSSLFTDKAWISNNTFSNLSASAVKVVDSKNVCIRNNVIDGTRTHALICTGNNISIWNNRLSNIGDMAQTIAVFFMGTNIHIFENTIEDFNYSAIGTGGVVQNGQCLPKSYIIERNTIFYTQAFSQKYRDKTLADGGGIYIGPQNTQGIIRNNVIDGICGIGINRGIFLDDGTKNVAVYGNLIMNTANCYDIDLRYCTTYASGIPDHNTNNLMFYNIMTGGYLFQDTGKEDSRCIGGKNLLLGTGDFQKKVVELKYSVPDFTLEGCKYKKGRVFIPKRYEVLLDNLHIDKFVRSHISLR